MLGKIIIIKNLIPYTFNILLSGKVYTIGVDYNATGDFFTLSLSDADGNILARGEKLVYNMPVFKDIYNPINFPKLKIIPSDESNEANAITWENFNETVLLLTEDEGDNNE